MAKSKKTKDFIKETEEYLEFLKKRLESKNYKANVTGEEFQKTREKYDKAKLRLKLLKPN
jgi:hypothetical protein